MYGLLYKDLILNKKQLLGAAAVILLFSITLFTPISEDGADEIFLMLCFIITVCIMLVVGMIQQGIYECDEFKKWQFFVSSAPNGIENQIASKYVLTILLSVFAVVYCDTLQMLACAVQGSEFFIPSTLLFELLPIQLLFRSIEIPFLIRFGSRHGNTFRMVIMSLLVFAVIVYLLFGDLSVFGSLEDFINFIVKLFIGDSGFSKGVTYFLRVSLAMSLVLYYVSYRISCNLYIDGGDYYDR